MISDIEQLKAALEEEKKKAKTRRFLKRAGLTISAFAAIVITITILWTPVLQIVGSSMTPTLYEGDVVVSVRSKEMRTGDLIAFYYNNTVLIKRLIGTSGDWINIDRDGTVYVNGKEINEPYIDEKALGQCNIELPCQVPENKVFVMGDHRSVSIDSRNTAIGFVSEEQVIGHIVCQIWPLKKIRTIHRY